MGAFLVPEHKGTDMHKYTVVLADGNHMIFEAERVHFTPTHVVFDNTEASLGHGRYELVEALNARLVDEVYEGAR